MMERKILLLCHRVPYPPDKGDRIRSYHLLRELSCLGRVDLGFLTDEPVREHTLVRLHELCGRVAFAPVDGWRRWLRASFNQATGRSATDGFFYSRSFQRMIDAWLHETRYDAIVAYSSSVLQYVQGRGVDDRLTADLVDVDSQKWFDYAERARRPLSWLFRREGGRVRQVERRAGACRAVVLISQAEAAQYRRIAPGANVVVACNGVDLDYFRPQPVEERETCVFVGYLDYRANILGLQWFCREVWPQWRARFPESRFQIVGRNSTPAVRSLARVPGVEVVGPVDDVRAYLVPARLVVVPLPVARGIQNKVLEAMSAGKPIIASSAALEGLPIAEGTHALRADTPAEWIAAAATLWPSPRSRCELGRAARCFVETHHDWRNCLRPLTDAAMAVAPEVRSRRLARTTSNA